MWGRWDFLQGEAAWLLCRHQVRLQKLPPLLQLRQHQRAAVQLSARSGILWLSCYRLLITQCGAVQHCMRLNLIYDFQFNLHFVSGTKFSGATQVCHHEAAVKCSDDQEEGENKNPPSIVISKQIAGNNFLSETNNNFIGGQSSALEGDYRFKREKLTDNNSRKTIQVEQKLLPDQRRTHKTKSKNKKASKKPVFKHFKKKFSRAPPPRLDDVVKSKEVVKSQKLEYNDDGNNCSQSTLCKFRKKEIRENFSLSSNKSNKNKKTAHSVASTVPDKNASHLKKSEKDIKVAAKLSLIKKEITPPPSEDKMDEDETEEMSDHLNVKPPPEVVLIPQSLDDDTNIKLREDTVIHNPIKSDSEILQNKSKTELKADIPISSPRPTTEASPPKKNLSFRTKPLNKLPFSRVVAAQKKRRPGEFSPYIPFPALLSNLTQSARSVRLGSNKMLKFISQLVLLLELGCISPLSLIFLIRSRIFWENVQKIQDPNSRYLL